MEMTQLDLENEQWVNFEIKISSVQNVNADMNLNISRGHTLPELNILTLIILKSYFI